MHAGKWTQIIRFDIAFIIVSKPIETKFIGSVTFGKTYAYYCIIYEWLKTMVHNVGSTIVIIYLKFEIRFRFVYD